MAKSKGIKTTDDEAAARTTRVIEMTLAGKSRAQIHAAFIEDYGIGIRAIDTYIRKAAMVLKDQLPTRREALALSVAQHRQMYEQAHEDGDTALCLRICQSMGRLFGLDQQYSVADLAKVLDIENKLTGKHFETRAQRQQHEADKAKPPEPVEEPTAEEADDLSTMAERDPQAALRLLTGTDDG